MPLTPYSDNKLNALGTFFHRQNYRYALYPENGYPRPIDLWYEKIHYGKIDNKDKAIFISESFLKQIKTGDNKPILACNFVTDAFQAFQRLMRNAQNSNRLYPESEFIDIKPVSAWKSASVLYHKYMKIIYDMFVNDFLTQEYRNQKIINFFDFVKVFTEFVNVYAGRFPITKTSFIKSKFCPPETSGLIINIKGEDHSSDNQKYERFISDKNFKVYAIAARNHGFYIDKNAPWRLVADLGSPALQPYISKYFNKNVPLVTYYSIDQCLNSPLTNKTNNLIGHTLEDIFDKFYYRTYEFDIETFKVYITQFYNSFVLYDPFTHSQDKLCRDGSVKLINREPITEEKILKKYGDNFWNKLFIYTLGKETNAFKDQKDFEKFVSSVSVLQKNALDKEKVKVYIDNRFCNVLDKTIDINGNYKATRNNIVFY
jgi:hypothetical protein